ncbi:hypothetical protein ACFU99_34170 [Streptomyces sp. NPDC057654]|uniref:hypothetical protein n=1 Tax=Streptomyces sp. NPDC057654 TaxID=3346196 RepID=UPI00368FA481
MGQQLSTPNDKIVIPYITTRDGENLGNRSTLRAHPTRGLYYTDEVPGDRDLRGVLWARQGHNPRNNRGQPTGRPIYAQVHPSRQRETMYGLRCQICCREPASRTDLGFLFLAELPPPDDADAGWPEGALTSQPPLCLPHAAVSAERCPPLIRGHLALRVKTPRLHGVLGLHFRPGWTALLHVLPDQETAIAYQDPRIRWYLATQLVRRLRGVTVIDLKAELATAARADQ